MWNPIKIEIQNLFSHKQSTYEFKNNACTVIFGRNDTDKNLDNNGAGKTTLFEAICIALTNESLRNIKKDNFINRDADSCRIEFELFNPAMRMNLKICRQFYRSNKPVRVEVWENGELNTQVVSVAEANKRVLELIGIGREDLLRYFIISQDNHYTFFTASDTEKKEIMNRITSADMINPVIDELSFRFTEKQSVYNALESEIGKLTEKKETLEEQRQEVLSEDDTADRIADIKERISDTESEINDKEESIEKLIKHVEKITAELYSTEPEDTSVLKGKRKSKKAEIDTLEKEIADNKRVKRNIESELDDKIVCPNCGEEFIPKSELELSVEDAERLLKETNKELEKQKQILDKKNEEVSQLTKKICEAESIQEHIDELESDKKRYERSIKNKREEIQELKSKISRWNEDIQNLKKKKDNNALLKSISGKIAECERDIVAKRADQVPVEEELNMIKFWQFHMGKSGFKTYLANRSVKIIEGITNSYLRKFGVDISVLINGFTILRSGEVREKIDIFVSNDGITSENFMAKSGGERGRVMLAGILGIQHLINLSTNGRGLNLLLLDEVFPGIDSRGQEKIINTLNKLGITVMLITQNVSESFNNENTLFVVKENNVSKYVNSQSL